MKESSADSTPGKTGGEGQTYEKIDFSSEAPPRNAFENCTFVSCNFSGVNLVNAHFSACEFRGCNLSNARLDKAVFRDVRFKGCKLLGLHFDACNRLLFSVDFDNCVLNFSTFIKLKLRKTRFKSSTLHEADFTEADLSGSVFDNCDLERTTFVKTILEKVDFRTSYNFSIDPDSNKMKKAKFSLAGLPGLLHKYDIEIE